MSHHWFWTGATDDQGVAVMRVDSTRIIRARILVYLWEFGNPPEGHVVASNCEWAKCVNPKHLTTRRLNVEKRYG